MKYDEVKLSQKLLGVCQGLGPTFENFVCYSYQNCSRNLIINLQDRYDTHQRSVNNDKQRRRK